MARPLAAVPPASRQNGLTGSRTVHDSLLTVKDIARLLNMSERWVHERTRRREIPCYRFGSALRFDLNETRAWMTRWHEIPEEN